MTSSPDGREHPPFYNHSVVKATHIGSIWVATGILRNVRQELFYFVNLAGHGVHINFVGVLPIDDFNLVDDAAVIFSHIHFNRSELAHESLVHARLASTIRSILSVFINTALAIPTIPRDTARFAAGGRRRFARTTGSSIDPQLMHRVDRHIMSASGLRPSKVSRTSSPLQR